ELEIVIGTTNALKDRLREKTLDVLIGGVVKEAGFTSHPLLNDVVVVVARDTHPIFRLEDIQLEDLLDYEWILPSSQISSRIWLDNLFWSRRLPKARVRIESNALPTIHGLIARTDFLSFLSRLTFEHPRNRGSLREVPVAAARLDRPLGITYPT